MRVLGIFELIICNFGEDAKRRRRKNLVSIHHGPTVTEIVKIFAF
jgi:hypothetical protein